MPHGYALKTRFELSTAGAWPLNVGQVYTTLARLERDGLVEAGGAQDEARQAWRITPAGRSALAEWYDTPVALDPPQRDELAIKVLLAVAAGQVDVSAILHKQRALQFWRVLFWISWILGATGSSSRPMRTSSTRRPTTCSAAWASGT